MYKTFTLPLKSALALAAFFILTACGGLTINLDSLAQGSKCLANPFGAECDKDKGIDEYRALIINDCANNPSKANTQLCRDADASHGTLEAPDAPVASESCEDNPFAEGCGSVGESVAITPKDTLIKPEFDKDGLAETNNEKVGIVSLEIVDLCSDPATAHDKQCTSAVIGCINHPFSGRCEGDNVLGNLVRGGVTLSKTVILQDKRARDCRDGVIDRSQCQILNSEKQRCTGAQFSDVSCSAVTYSVCKADAFDPLCGEKENFAGVYFNERSDVCYEQPNNPYCTGTNGHVAVVCSEYPFDRLCAGNPVVPRQITASVWADSFDESLATEATVADRYNSKSQFLIGRATDLDSGGVPLNTIRTSGNLNLADATFNGVALGGERADGLAFLTTGARYAGILSGTNLGAPLTDAIGTAKWIGSFQLAGYSPTDFVLTVSFGTGSGAGEIEALIQSYIYFSDHHIKGEFDDAGVITGTADTGFYRRNDPASRRETATNHYSPGKLTGIIGEEGAVGAFIIDNIYGVGGFVARPSSAKELADLAQTCADDPFNTLCTIGYESERNAILDHCIIGGNANDERCDSANDLDSCIKHPFRSGCADLLPEHYEQVRINREAFCRTAGNADNELCTSRSTVSYICTNYPFDAACLGDDRFTRLRKIACSGNPFATRCAGDVYNNVRVRFCAANAGNPACPTPDGAITEPTITVGATPQVTAKVWADSFDTPLSHGASASDRKSKFLIGRETDLDTGGLRIKHDDSPNYSGTSNLADATFNGVALGGDAADGISYFAAARTSWGGFYSYAGILEGTNLGAPLTDTQGSAKWIGSFILQGSHPADFVLNISFGIGDGVGEVEAFAQTNYDYHIQGEFDDTGVITGTARWGGHFGKRYKTINVGWEVGSGKLTGLIGEEGAVGAFLFYGRYGGFVARPPSAKELQDLTQTCADDPFNSLCNVGYESERVARIEHCITGGNGNDERCDSVDNWYPCIRDPFGRCNGSFLSDFSQVRANRVAFCRTAGNANNALCTVAATYHYVCTNHPFDAQCLSNNDYTPLRRNACLDDPFTTRCTGDVYNDLRVSFCEANVGNPACPRPVVPDTVPTPVPTTTSDRVTTADWLASFNSPLSASSTRVGNHFVTTIATGLDETHLRSIFGNDPYVNTLNLADATFKGRSLNGDATDGVVIFRGKDRRSTIGPEYGNITHYAGILPGTNLGAPLNEPDGQVIWHGQFRASGHEYANRDFSLHIHFGDGDGAGTLRATVQEARGDQYYRINGRFDDNGVITGTSKFGRGYYGILTGLIGEEGAVGVFVSNGLYYGGYVGGFVASPTLPDLSLADTTPNRVTAADWVASFETAPAHVADVTSNHFLQIRDIGTRVNANFSRPVPTIYGRSFSNISHYSLKLNDDVFQDGGGDAFDGVVFYKANNGNASDSYFYAGVIHRTNLGAPLIETSGSATWSGRFQAVLSGSVLSELNRDFTLNIAFNGTGGDISTAVSGSTEDYFELDGTFNKQGVISGTANHVYYENGRIGGVTGDIVNTGPVTGLIGQEGAVGAFFSNRQTGNTGGFSGGFVARPPSQ